ncbi:MAG: AsmA-like C-terminal domain-containing protein [Pseudomonadota bacterium]
MIFAEALAAVMAGVSIAIILVLWAVLSGPVSLNVLKPNFEKALAKATLDGYRVQLGDLVLRWDEADTSIALVAKNASLFDANGDLAAAAPEIRLWFSGAALARGMIAPAAVELDEAEAVLVRGADGVVRLGFGGVPREPENQGAPETFGQFLNPLHDQTPAGYLRRIELAEGRFTFIDDANEVSWSAPNAVMRMERDENGVAAYVKTQFGMTSGENADLTFTLRYSDESKTSAGEAVFNGILPRDFSGVHPSLNVMEALETPMSGRIGFNLSDEGQILAANVDVAAGAGRVLLGGRSGRAVPVEQGRLAAAYDPETEALEIERLYYEAGENSADIKGPVKFLHTLDLDPSDLDAFDFDLEIETLNISAPNFLPLPQMVPFGRSRIAGRADLENGVLDLSEVDVSIYEGRVAGAASIALADGASPAIKADLEMTGVVTPQQVLTLWPTDRLLGARDWIEGNLAAGDIYKAEFAMDLKPGAFEVAGHVPDDQLRLDFDYRNGVATYVPGLPPLTQLRGAATLTGNGFYLTAASGRVGDIAVKDAVVNMKTLVPVGEPAVFSGTASGLTADILALLDMEPFGFARQFGVDPATLGGTSAVDFEITRALRRHVPIENVGYKAKAKINNFSMPDVVSGIGLDQGELVFELDKTGIVTTGTAALNGAPVTLTWTERFFTEGLSTSFDVKGEIDSTTRDAFGFLTRSFLNGPIQFSVQAKGEGTNIRIADIEADFTETEIELDSIGWSKREDSPASARLSLRTGADDVMSAEAFDMFGEGLDVKGSAAMGADGRLLSADLSTFKIKDVVDISLSAGRDEASGALAVDMNGAFFNAGPILENFLSPGEGEMDWGRGLSVSGQVDELRLRKGVALGDARLSFLHTGDRVANAAFSGEFKTGARAKMRLQDSDRPGVDSELVIESENAGAVIQGLFGIESVYGGTMLLAADMTDAGIDGLLAVEKFRVIDAPFLANLLSAASLTGLVNVLNGDGIAFTNLDSEFVYADGVLTVADTRASGASMGLTADGSIDFANERIRANGAVAPAYAINSAFGALPIIGDALVSRKGEGLFALSYNLSGDMGEPTIFVNPLSALTPGALRRIFEPVPESKTDNSDLRLDIAPAE